MTMYVRLLGLLAAAFAIVVALSDGRIPFGVTLVVGLALIVGLIVAVRAQRR